MKTILVCDDDEGIADVIKIILQAKGYKVIAITNSQSLIPIIEKEIPALIILDLWMPNITGDKVVRKLKTNPLTKNISIIIMSANRDAAKISKEVEADDYIDKPFDISTLEKKVEKILKKI